MAEAEDEALLKVLLQQSNDLIDSVGLHVLRTLLEQLVNCFHQANFSELVEQDSVNPGLKVKQKQFKKVYELKYFKADQVAAINTGLVQTFDIPLLKKLIRTEIISGYIVSDGRWKELEKCVESNRLKSIDEMWTPATTNDKLADTVAGLVLVLHYWRNELAHRRVLEAYKPGEIQAMRRNIEAAVWSLAGILEIDEEELFKDEKSHCMKVQPDKSTEGAAISEEPSLTPDTALGHSTAPVKAMYLMDFILQAELKISGMQEITEGAATSKEPSLKRDTAGDDLHEKEKQEILKMKHRLETFKINLKSLQLPEYIQTITRSFLPNVKVLITVDNHQVAEAESFFQGHFQELWDKSVISVVGRRHPMQCVMTQHRSIIMFSEHIYEGEDAVFSEMDCIGFPNFVQKIIRNEHNFKIQVFVDKPFLVEGQLYFLQNYKELWNKNILKVFEDEPVECLMARDVTSPDIACQQNVVLRYADGAQKKQYEQDIDMQDLHPFYLKKESAKDEENSQQQTKSEQDVNQCSDVQESTDSSLVEMNMEEKYEQFWKKMEKLISESPEIQGTYFNQKWKKIVINVDHADVKATEGFFEENFSDMWEESLLEVVGQQPFHFYIDMENTAGQDPGAATRCCVEAGCRITAVPPETFAENRDRILNKEISLADVCRQFDLPNYSGSTGGFVHDLMGTAYLLTAFHVLRCPTEVNARSIRPKESLDVRPKENLDVKPKESLHVKPKESLDVRHKESLDVRPKESLDVRPKESLDFRHKESPNVRPKESPDVRPKESLDVRHMESLDVRPKKSPDVRPKICDIVPESGSAGGNIPVITEVLENNESYSGSCGKIYHIGSETFGFCGVNKQTRTLLDFALVKITQEVRNCSKLCPVNSSGEHVELKVFREETRKMYKCKVEKEGAETGHTTGTVLPIMFDIVIDNKRCEDTFHVISDNDKPFSVPGDSGSSITSIIGEHTTGEVYGLLGGCVDEYTHLSDEGWVTYTNMTTCLRLDHCFQFAASTWGIQGLQFFSNKKDSAPDEILKMTDQPLNTIEHKRELRERFKEFVELMGKRPPKYIQSYSASMDFRRFDVSVEIGKRNKAEVYIKNKLKCPDNLYKFVWIIEQTETSELLMQEGDPPAGAERVPPAKPQLKMGCGFYTVDSMTIGTDAFISKANKHGIDMACKMSGMRFKISSLGCFMKDNTGTSRDIYGLSAAHGFDFNKEISVGKLEEEKTSFFKTCLQKKGKEFICISNQVKGYYDEIVDIGIMHILPEAQQSRVFNPCITNSKDHPVNVSVCENFEDRIHKLPENSRLVVQKVGVGSGTTVGFVKYADSVCNPKNASEDIQQGLFVVQSVDKVFAEKGDSGAIVTDKLDSTQENEAYGIVHRIKCENEFYCVRLDNCLKAMNLIYHKEFQIICGVQNNHANGPKTSESDTGTSRN